MRTSSFSYGAPELHEDFELSPHVVGKTFAKVVSV